MTVTSTAPLTRRERSRIAKTETILDTAMALVQAEGLEALSLHRIARELDWAVGGLYRYFESRDALYTQLQLRVIAHYEASLRATLADTSDPALGLLTSALHYQRYFLSRPGHFALIALSVGTPRHLLPDEQAKRVMSEAMGALRPIESLFRNAAENGSLSEGSPALNTMVFWSTIHGALQLGKLTRFSPEMSRDALFDEAIVTLMSGWGADRKALTVKLNTAHKRVAEQLPWSDEAAA